MNVLDSLSTLHIIDSTLCVLIFFPSMVLYWRGIWDLIGVYILPEQEPLCHWVTACIGSCTVIGYIVLPFLNHYLRRDKKVAYVILSRTYLYVYGALAMCYWRGVWSLADYYLLQYGWLAGLAGLLICFSLLTGLRVSRTLIFPPFIVFLDTREDALVAGTLIGTQVDVSRLKMKTMLLYTADSCITQLIVLTLTIVTWRSAMNIVDCLLYPDDPLFADLLSASVGLIACVFIFSIERLLAKAGSALYKRWPRSWVWLVYEDAVYALVFCAEVFTWRGVWNLTATYVISDKLVGGWVNHAVGSVLLLSLQLISYAGCSGCGFDGRVPNISGRSLFNTKYLRNFFKSRINKKRYDLGTGNGLKHSHNTSVPSSSSFISTFGAVTDTSSSVVKVKRGERKLSDVSLSNHNQSCSSTSACNNSSCSSESSRDISVIASSRIAFIASPSVEEALKISMDDGGFENCADEMFTPAPYSSVDCLSTPDTDSFNSGTATSQCYNIDLNQNVVEICL